MTTTITRCPDWCTLAPGHGWDSIDATTGRESRTHGGPNFGPNLDAFADEFSDMPGILAYGVRVYTEYDNLSPRQLLDLASQAIAAAQWLEAHR